jgi:cytochrome oxidase assembly protein ShyY1
VLIILAVAGMGFLSHWQIDRLHQREHRNDLIHEAMNAPPLSSIPSTDTPNWRRVQLTGSWDANNTFLLRYPLYNGQSGFEVVTPLITDTGTIPVDRGWVTLEQGKALKPADSAVTKNVAIDAWYRHAAQGDEKRSTADASTPSVTKITTAYLQLLPNHPAGDVMVNGTAITPVTRDGPDLSNGPHWSYALQWISFCLIAFIGWGTLLYRVWRDEQMEPEQRPVTHTERA